METQFETLISGVLEHQYGFVDDFISPSLTESLRNHLLERFEAGEMKPAGIGQRFSYDRNLEVRGDVIFWLEKQHNAAEKAFLEHIEAFIDYLNRTCYTGINAYEFHYALYAEGSFYKRHRDQFKSDQGRKFSLVTYLNQDWLPEDGGTLFLYPGDSTIGLLPEAGRAVFFKADEVEHEVKPAQRRRLSIAGWLKRV